MYRTQSLTQGTRIHALLTQERGGGLILYLISFSFNSCFYSEKRCLEIFSICAAALLNSYVIYKMIINFQAKDTVTMVTSLCKSTSMKFNMKVTFYRNVNIIVLIV